MSILVVKIVMLATMGAFALLFGLLPIKIYKYVELQRVTKFSEEKLATRLLSILSCLSGGVFLGVCLLDLLPTASEAFDKIKQQNGWETEYPLIGVLIGCGFFIVYLMEILAIHICDRNHIDYEVKRNECKHCKNKKDVIEERFNRGKQEENASQGRKKQIDVSVVELKISKKDNYVKSITLVVALTVHSCLEGFTFGVQYTMFTVATLFLGIIVHKSVVAFSIGMNLIKTHPSKTYFVILLVIFMAVTSPIGGFIGIALESVELGEQPRNIVTAIASSLANGTFIYITFFEILYTEHEHGERKMAQWLSAAVGFGLIAILMLFAH
ncbi:ZIP Zinc transporter [Loa loa]|uniref:ZIP Zinc transporter n=1 Tax=Loa loa TaxID=7209 RepID=A0A1I7VLB5_LOALO|nr:ZIP Zinc transporter [Loa loa]EFO19990.1 ZIP Zinc transporter [Loa loa]